MGYVNNGGVSFCNEIKSISILKEKIYFLLDGTLSD